MYLSSKVALTTSYIRVLPLLRPGTFPLIVGKAWLSRSTSRCTTWSTEDHGTPHSAHSRSAVLPHAEQTTLQRWQKKSALSRAHVTFTHTIFHAQLCHTHTHELTDTYIRTYVRTYMHTIFSHTFTQSFTTSFVFPSFPVPATTFEAQYWKKLTCGVIRSFNSFFASRSGLGAAICAVIMCTKSFYV